MRFFWKIYFSFMVLLLLSFGIFGTWMIQLTFEKSYQRALTEAERENRMFQLSFEMNLNALGELYQDDGIIPVTAASIVQNLSDSGSVYQIYNHALELLYENKGHEPFDNESVKSTLAAEDAPCGYQLLNVQGEIYLIFACRSTIENRVYYLENIRDISDIYEEREEYYDWYTLVMLVLTGVATVVVFVVTHVLTRSIRELSRTTRRFSRGDYEVRAQEKGRDEITELASDFNHMADTISEKMEELTMQAKKQEDFSASFAHELKTPLTSIIGYADMLRTVDCTREETLEAVNYIFQQGKRLESLSYKLLELIVSDKQDYKFRTLSIEKLAQNAIRLTAIKRKEKEITLWLGIEEGRIKGERDLLISVFTNLLDNARKATDPGGTITVRGRQYPGNYLFCIMDNGCGMEQKEIARITEAFYMVDKSRARKEGGAGLGMTLCSRILAIHGARWRIFSIPGKGTAVAIQFQKTASVRKEPRKDFTEQSEGKFFQALGRREDG
ncbi:MAG: HAMP domain-containing histidine kinase [Lachnospiraceae bacterium]|nr:HAMP domain-containing histidine kinase [Lachnospiraceae bacterium]